MLGLAFGDFKGQSNEKVGFCKDCAFYTYEEHNWNDWRVTFLIVTLFKTVSTGGSGKSPFRCLPPLLSVVLTILIGTGVRL